jgi:N-acetylmuramoyl-L-alanine amidase
MAPQYVIKQGDYLAKIAKENGFVDYRTIWDHPQNKQLKDKRKNPNVLAPGDELFIPDKVIREEEASTDQKHKYQAKTSKNMLRFVLEDLYGNPIANAKCELRVEGEVYQVASGADGKIEHEIPLTAQSGELVIKEGNTALKDVKLDVLIGHLDPVEQKSGQVARLSNLGYYLGRLDLDDTAKFQSSVEEFQCDYNLTVDGDCGPMTQAKLKQVHGC